MGIRGLWHILDPIQEYRPLAELGGETVAVDLSIWVCGDMSIKCKKKLYLRNLFFRTLHLLRLNVLPVIVTDGIAPKLKTSTLTDRHCESGHLYNPTTILQRRRLSTISGECCALLDAIGVPWIQSPGEAEAMCASLNCSKNVDACITNDGDVFLYGATTVYRHFSMDTRDCSVRVYRSSRVESDLHLTRYHLVVLSILLGCDYWPDGIAGVGKVGVRRLIRSLDPLKQAELVDLVSFLKTRRPCTESDFLEFPFFRALDVKTLRLWIKAGASLQKCPIDDIFYEFLATSESRGWDMSIPPNLVSWRRPNLRSLVSFCRSQLDWYPDYTLHHVLPVLALWDIRHPRLPTYITSVPFEPPVDETTVLIPTRIIKKRTVNFVPSYDVEWKRLGFDVWSHKAGLLSKTFRHNDGHPGADELVEVYTFPVPIAEFQQTHADICARFESETQNVRMKTLKKNATKPSNKKKLSRTESRVINLINKLRLSSTPPKTLHPGLPKWDSSSGSDICSPLELTERSSPAMDPCALCSPSVLKPAFHFSPLDLHSNFSFGDMKQLQSSLVSPLPMHNLSTEDDKENSSPASVRPQCTAPDDEDPFDIFATPLVLKERIARMQKSP